jgi:ABC-type multidrug transport system fused ATPase/permease subunit
LLLLVQRFKEIKKDSMPSTLSSSHFSVRQSKRRPSTLSRQSIAGGDRSLMVVSRADFIEHYPQLLLEITVEENAGIDEEASAAEKPGVDICFQDLSLNIKVGDRNISVVEKVTGRLRGRTMTALMGGSGAGKTSLLNALCGRAFYGNTSGTIHVNGHLTSIEEHKDSVGFVPQVSQPVRLTSRVCCVTAFSSNTRRDSIFRMISCTPN